MQKILDKIWSYINLPSITRVSLDKKLIPTLQSVRKADKALGIGSSKDDIYIKHLSCDKFYSMDIRPQKDVDVVGDIHNLDWESDYFETIVAIEVLEHCYDPKLAISEIHRLLKSGGTCILSTRFMFPYHPCDKDYFRFTQDSLNDMFSMYSDVEIVHHGNGFQVFWQMISYRSALLTFPLRIFNNLIASFDSKSTVYPSGFIVRAIK